MCACSLALGTAVPHERGLLHLGTHHHPRRVDQGDHRQIERVAQLQEPRRLVGTVAVDGTGEVVRVVLLFYLMPIWAVLLARVLMGEPLRALSIGLVLLAVVGAGIVLWRPGVGVPLPASRADWLGVAGGMLFALTNVLLLKHASAASASRAAAMFAGATVIPAVVALAMAASGADVPLPALQSGALLPLVLVAVLFLAGNLALQFGAARLPTRVTAVIMLSEVVFAALSAVWLADEVLTLQMTLGAALIIGASLLSALSSRR